MKASRMRPLVRYPVSADGSSYVTVAIYILSYLLKEKANKWNQRLHYMFNQIYELDEKYQREPTRENARNLKKLKKSYKDSMLAYRQFVQNTNFSDQPTFSQEFLDSLPLLLSKRETKKKEEHYKNQFGKDKKHGRNRQLLEEDYWLETM